LNQDQVIRIIVTVKFVYLSSFSTRRQRSDLCSLQVKLPPVTTSLTTQSQR